MATVRRPKEIRDFIIKNLGNHPKNIGQFVVSTFGVTRSAVSKHMKTLIHEGLVVAEGATSARRYALAAVLDERFEISVDKNLSEDIVWRERVLPLLKDLNPNVRSICSYGFNEMFNNVIEHSESKTSSIHIIRTAATVSLRVVDYGVGIFHKIQSECGLLDSRHALLELSKGKLTTDEKRHTGEGIFFTSRMFDKFIIDSGTLGFVKTLQEEDDWLIEITDMPPTQGTTIFMEIGSSSERVAGEIFQKYSIGKADEEGLDFSRTHVPLQLMLYEGVDLVSRSQARRLLARLEGFREVLLDFQGVQIIGQGFADEIFRVYKNDHPRVSIVWVNAIDAVEHMIRRAGLVAD